MKHIVSLSGGASSYYTLKYCLDNFNKEDIIPIFCDTNIEDESLYIFLDEIEQRHDIKIIRLDNDGKTPMDIAYEDEFIFNSRVANCTIKLKRRTFKKYLKQFKKSEYILYFGIGFLEHHRAVKIAKHYNKIGVQVKFPIDELALDLTTDFKQQLVRDGFTPQALYNEGFSHNNCGGACFKAGKKHWYLLLQKRPHIYFKWAEDEKKLQDILVKKGKKPSTILKDISLYDFGLS